MTSRINAAGVALIKKYEGLRLTAEVAREGKLVIGYGHTGKDVFQGQKITESRADQLLLSDLSWVEDSVARRIEVTLNENEFSALVSLTRDIGARKFSESTLRSKLNKGDTTGAAEAFTWFSEASPSVVSNRRAAERELFISPVPRVNAQTS